MAYMSSERPQIIDLGKLFATQINTLYNVVALIPDQNRQHYLDQINGPVKIPVLPDGSPADIPQGDSYTIRLFIKTVRSRLRSGVGFRWRNDLHQELWFTLDIGNRKYWMTLPVSPSLHHEKMTSALLLSLSMAMLSTLGALLIQRRINRPLGDIAAAARKLGAGGRPERLPTYATTELATVALHFNAMSDNLEEMESTRALMLAGISHDIRTPLTKLRLALAMDSQASEMLLAPYVEQIDAIVGQFLDFARNGSDEAMIEGDINTLIRQIASRFDEQEQAFELLLEPLPPMRFRPVAMQRIIDNLMGNAVKYGLFGFQVRSWHEDRRIHIAILDRGPGLAGMDVTKLLRPFTRADAGRSGVSGTGLGLAIVDRLVRLHGGELRLLPRKQGGLKAWVSLPYGGRG